MYAIAKSLEKIEKDFGHVVSRFKRIKTDSYSSQDREKEKEESEQRHAEYLKNRSKEN